MRLTTKGRFAVTAMVDLAQNSTHNAVKLNAISERQQISLFYLEQLFSKLRKAGLVDSVRGPGGGYVLKHAPEHINVVQIIEAVEDKLDATLCSGKANCQSGESCLTHDLWHNLNHTIHHYLSSITLLNLLQKKLPEHTMTFHKTHQTKEHL